MSEIEPTPEVATPSRDQVIDAFKPFVERGIISPDDLSPNDPEVVEANKLLKAWSDHARVVADKSPDPATLSEYELSRSTFYTDAGFSDPDYLDEVANDWLIQDLDRAEASGLDELAAKIQAKIDELNARLPAEVKEDE